MNASIEASNSSSDDMTQTSCEATGIGDEHGDWVSFLSCDKAEKEENLNCDFGLCGTMAVVTLEAYERVLSPSEGSLSLTSSVPSF